MYPLMKQTAPANSWQLFSLIGFQEKHASLAYHLQKSSPKFGNYHLQTNFTIQPSSISLNGSNSASVSQDLLEKSDEHTQKVITNNRSSAANACPLTPLTFLERAAVVYGDSPSILYNGTSRTWSEMHTRCLKLASSIAARGIKKGDIVSVVAPNVPPMCELHFAVPMAGAIINTINLKLDAHAISNLLQHAQTKLIFVDYQSLSIVLEAISIFPPSTLHDPLDVVVIKDDDIDEPHHAASSSKNRNHFQHEHRMIDYEEMIESGDPRFQWIRPDSEWEPIALNYTSGTTSSPKGVLQSHRGAFLQSLNSWLSWSIREQPVYLWALPMFHENGWCYAWSLAAVGGTNVCLRRVDTPSIYEALETHKVTHMCGAPVVINMLTNHNRKPLKTPVHIMTAGAPPPAAVLSRAESLGFIITHGYGLTETAGPVVTCAWKKEWDQKEAPERAKLKSRQGVTTVLSEAVDVLDPDSGESVPRDGSTMGEIVLRGGTVMLGYLKDPEATSKCMREDGWFYTGDVGVVHPDGYIEVKDRSKDVIICGGENLSSVEVEAVLYSHPAVNEAAVVARPSKFWGETPCAFVSFKDEAAEKPTEKDIREFCKARLPLYMVPRTVVFKDELPKTSTGKIQKFLLRDMAKNLNSSAKHKSE